MISCIAIDDEPLALEVIKTHCQKINFIDLKKTFLSVVEAIEFLNTVTIDVLFLDINMPEINGLEVKSLIPNHIQIVFVTAYAEYALESYNLDATDYVMKPLSFQRFYKAAQKCLDNKNGNVLAISPIKEETILVRGDKKVMQIIINEIHYIEGLKDYAKIYYGDGQKVVIRESLKRILEQLVVHHFFRVHRSFIVPIHKITAVYGGVIKIGDNEIPMSKGYRESILSQFKKRGILGDRSTE